MSDYLDPANEELLKDFFMEAQAQIETLERNILVLETDPDNRESVDEIFRAAHTLKGNSGAVEMFEISEFTHILEDLLDDVRSEKIKVDSEIIDILLESIDIVKAMIETRMGGEIYSEDITEIKEVLKSLQGSTKAASPALKTAAGAGLKADKSASKKDTPAAAPVYNEISEKRLSEYEILELTEASDADEQLFEVEVFFNEDNPMNSIGGIQIFAKMKEIAKVLLTKPDFDELYDDNYNPVVYYYISSNRDKDEIKDKSFINEVTTEVVVNLIEKKDNIPQLKESSKESEIEEISEDNNYTEAESEQTQSPQDRDNTKVLKIKKPTITESTVLKVDSRRIDNLLNLVSETVINKAAFNQISSQFLSVLDNMHLNNIKVNEIVNSLFDSLGPYIRTDVNIKLLKKDLFSNFDKSRESIQYIENSLKSNITKLINTSQNFGRITNELHESVLQIRMVPISQIFSRFPRLVRDVSKKLNKKINLVIEGEDTELDKSVIELLLDPLIHCVRNSMDHGVEEPSARKEKGKNEEGTILLKAKNEGNMILIEITDDGKGIDVEVIKEKAIKKGILHPGKILTEVEAFNLIFEPGFSTAAEITDISGRGVGLDVVRRQIEKLNGSVHVSSKINAGTTLTIRLPLTLAIIQGLLVRVGKELYAIPITSVIESQRIHNSDIKNLDNYEVFDIREDVVSLVRLGRLFGLKSDEDKNTHYIVVVGSADKKIGLMVDQLIGEEDVVIKPLKDKYTNVAGIAGATILGDGQVSLILDVNQILEMCYTKEKSAREQRNRDF